MSKARIYEFDPLIYPRILWVVRGGTKDDIKAKFLNNEQEEINFGDREDFSAWTCNVVHKADNKYGIAVWFPNKITIKCMCHEATHAMFYYCQACGLDVVDASDEHLAYLMGWICDCIDKVRTNKIKDK